MRPGKPEGRIPEYFRDGIVSLFVALYIRIGDVLGKCYRRHRAKEFLSLRKEIETHVTREAEECKEIHLVVDNYSSHYYATVNRWLMKRPHRLDSFLSQKPITPTRAPSSGPRPQNGSSKELQIYAKHYDGRRLEPPSIASNYLLMAPGV